ncbi:MAG: filamentous hemagglutinin N-terminal domain-containing protein [Elainellaceae cyanobacterium]
MPVFSTSAQCWKTEAIALSPRLLLRLSTTLSTVAIALTGFALPGVAQSLIVPDDTLGAEGSVVFENFGGIPNEVIGGGAQRAQNLFHSFEEFNVDEGRGAFFFSPDGIANIFNRVTGNNPSNILGTLGTFGGNADLFFMNPNGILFGPNSSLNVQGSFAAITADAIEFGEEGFFSATNPEVPSDLLTVDPSAFFFNQIPAGNITNQSVAPIAPGVPLFAGLRVPNGENLLLLGGEVSIDGGRLTAFGGRVDIGAVDGAGSVALSPDGSLFFPEDLERASIRFDNGAFVDTRSDGRGDIAVTGQNIVLSEGSNLIAGITAGLEGVESRAGDIILNATESIQITEFSLVGNGVFLDATGAGGNIIVDTSTLELLGGAQIAASVFGEGDVGDVQINATDRVTIDGSSEVSGFGSGILNTVEANAEGDGGNIIIDTTILEVLDGAQLAATTLGEGNAGKVQINATDRVTFEGTSDDGTLRSSIVSGVEPDAVGDGGNIIIDTTILEVLDGAQLAASTFGEGNAGEVQINASDRVTFEGTSGDGVFISGALSLVGSNAAGDGGDIIIDTTTLELLNGATLNASTAGEGNAGEVQLNASDRVTFEGTSDNGASRSAAASVVGPNAVGNGGNIVINTATIEVLNGATLNASTAGEGNAGEVQLNASERVTFEGTNVFSIVGPNAVGNGGDIIIDTTTLEVLNGAALNASTGGEGNAGRIEITATDHVRFEGTSNDDVFRSAAVSSVEAGAVGNASDIIITTTTLEVLNGAQLLANTFGEGDAGGVKITAIDRVTFEGTSNDGVFSSAAFSTVEAGAIGDGGNIEVTTTTLKVLNGARLSASTGGMGNAGSVLIEADDRVTFEGTSNDGVFSSAAFSTVEAGAIGDGGNIEVTTTTLEVLNGARLSASTGGMGNAGSVLIEADDRVTFEGTSDDNSVFRSGAFSTVAVGAIGDGGNIEIKTLTLEVLDGAQLLTSNFGEGNAGSVVIEASDRTTFTGTSGDGVFSSAALSSVAAGAMGDGGDIEITTRILEVLNGAGLSASTFGEGNAGSVVIEASDRTTFAGTSEVGTVSVAGSTVGSTVEAGAVGDGGDIRITTTSLEVLDAAFLSTTTAGEGNAGRIRLDVTGTISISGASEENSQLTSGISSSILPGGRGNAGDILIRANNLSVEDGSQIAAVVARPQQALQDAQGETLNGGRGQAGNIQIRVVESIVFSGTNISGFSSGILTLTEREAWGRGGNISINTGSLRIEDGAIIVASTFNPSNAGNITINADSLDLFEGGQIVTNTRNSGNAGQITLDVSGDIVIDGFDSDFGDRIERARAYVQLPDVSDRISDVIVNQGRSSGIFANTETENSIGDGGSIQVTTSNLQLLNGGAIVTQSEGEGLAGDITLNVSDRLEMVNGEVVTEAFQSSGGNIAINTRDGFGSGQVLLQGDSDITTSSQNDGGNIDIRGAWILAFDDSDILAFSADGRGGNVTLDTPAFFGESFTPASLNADPSTLDNNDRVDINASGAVSGTVLLPDVNFIQNSLNDLPESLINTEDLIANSCVVQNEDGSSTFVITGAGGLPERPGETSSAYPTGEVQTVPEDSDRSTWQPGDPIIEPQGVYQLPTGELVLSHACR